MMDNLLQSTLTELTHVQRQAVDWDDGSLLVLAGPGSGKTRVLTCRIARLLDSSRDRRFRILALTFTNKAANEMANRVTVLVPGLEGRANIGTFHRFCTQVLQQHGIHVGIRPDFAIYSQAEDRKALLEDALLRDEGHAISREDVRFLPLIDHLKGRLIRPEEAEERLAATNGYMDPGRAAHVYRLYEQELRRVGALDFNSLILEAHRLFTTFPAIARQYQKSYPYWLIDEFQDTNGAQYALLRSMAVGGFREVFAVADDDQTIFEWNGANVRRIGELVEEFSCAVLQLPTNFRCPPVIVEAANRLVMYNSRRVVRKQPATAAGNASSPSMPDGIEYREFGTDCEETDGIADEIGRGDRETRSGTAVLARNHTLLNAMQNAFEERAIPAELTSRRDDFVSPQMRWFVASLKQIRRPLDRRNLAVLVESFNGFAGPLLDWETLVSRSETDGITGLSVWTDAVRNAGISSAESELVDPIANLAAGSIKLQTAIKQVLAHFENEDPDDNLKEDLSAWRRIVGEIRDTRIHASLDGFLRELDLRSKEPVPRPGAVSLTSIHGAKGREFDTVYLIGMAEEVLPSWQSIKKGSAALEEERRGCFVAITRTKRRLILSRAQRYRGYGKAPSRFLEEMGCRGDHAPDGTMQRVG